MPMKTFTIRLFLVMLIGLLHLVDGKAQVPEVYEGAEFVEFVRFHMPAIYSNYSYYVNLTFEADGRLFYYRTANLVDDNYFYYENDEILNGYSFPFESNLAFQFYCSNSTGGFISGEKVVDNEDSNLVHFYDDFDDSDCSMSNCILPHYVFRHIVTPLLHIKTENSNPKTVCQTEFIELDIEPLSSECLENCQEFSNYILGASLEVSLAGQQNWKTIRTNIGFGSTKVYFEDIDYEWINKEIVFRLKQDIENVPFVNANIHYIDPNELRSSLPTYYSEPITGFYFLENPDITIPSVTQPTCHDSNDATITIGNIPVSNEENQVRINLIKYFEEPSTLSDYGQVKNIGDTLFWVDQITDYFDVPKGQNSLAIDQNKISNGNFKLTSGYYGIEAFYTDGSASGLCYKAIDNRSVIGFIINTFSKEIRNTPGFN